MLKIHSKLRLFTGPTVPSDRMQRLSQIQLKLMTLKPQNVADKSPEQVIEEILKPHLFGQVSINWDNLEQSREADFVGEGVTIVHLEVPTSGNSELLALRPQTSASMQPMAGDVVSGVILYDPYGKSREEIQKKTASWKSEVSRIVDALNQDARWCDEEMRRQCEEEVRNRFKAFGVHADIKAALPYPMKRRERPVEIFNIPAQKHQALTELRQSENVEEPCYTLVEKEYRYILRVLHNMSVAFEHLAPTVNKLYEPDLRNILLVALNGHYEGQAGAEVFNSEGKTDICIRHKSTNVFIAECKFWEGPSGLKEALSQLAGYVTWRDTKATLIVFNRNEDFDAVLKKIDETVTALASSRIGERERTMFEYRFRSAKHPEHDFDLTVLAYDITVRRRESNDR